MNKLLTIVAFMAMFFPFSAMADEGQTLTINGQQVDKAVVRITFEGDNVVLHFADGTLQQEDMDVVVLKLDASLTDIYTLKETVNNKLNIEGLASDTEVSVYDASGRLVLTAVASKTKAALSAKTLKSGLYVIKAGRQIVKFIKR